MFNLINKSFDIVITSVTSAVTRQVYASALTSTLVHCMTGLIPKGTIRRLWLVEVGGLKGSSLPSSYEWNGEMEGYGVKTRPGKTREGGRGGSYRIYSTPARWCAHKNFMCPCTNIVLCSCCSFSSYNMKKVCNNWKWHTSPYTEGLAEVHNTAMPRCLHFIVMQQLVLLYTPDIASYPGSSLHTLHTIITYMGESLHTRLHQIHMNYSKHFYLLAAAQKQPVTLLHTCRSGWLGTSQVWVQETPELVEHLALPQSCQ